MEVQAQIEQFGETLWNRVLRHSPSRLSPEYWLGWALDASMRDEVFRTPLFHLVDVLPSLRNPDEIADHAAALLRQNAGQPSMKAALARFAAGQPILGRLLARIVRAQTLFLGRRFIAGTTWDDAVPKLAPLHRAGVGFSIDILGEKTHSEHDGTEYAQRYQRLITSIANTVQAWPNSAVLQESALGPIPVGNVSVKVSALDPRLDSVSVDASVTRLCERLRPIVRLCQDRNVFINLDMESWGLHEITLRAFERLALDDEFRTFPHIGMVLQAYLRDAHTMADRIVALAEKRGTPFTVRLVKGAYWDFEVAYSQQYGFSCPVFTRKTETDAQYERVSSMLLDHHTRLTTAFASHNIRSLAHALVQARRRNVPENGYEIQMLYGAARPEREAMRESGHRVRLYAPIGEILPGMAYLVRRLLENSANTGFLRQAYQEHKEIHTLLKPPQAAA